MHTLLSNTLRLFLKIKVQSGSRLSYAIVFYRFKITSSAKTNVELLRWLTLRLAPHRGSEMQDQNRSITFHRTVIQ